MREVYSFIKKAARVEMPFLIVGETGTGKELVAREIHRRGPSREGPFVAVNTGAVSRDLIASELFGHVKGAFTGAVDTKTGRFQEAAHGTLFLDEIGTMDERVQVALLRVLETRKFRRVGGKRDVTVDARIITATNLNLQTAVRRGQFREDLLHRLQGLQVALPPLRRRKADIPLLANRFLAAFEREFESDVTGISREAMRVLRQYRWPGNIRELKNVIAQAAVTAEQGELLPNHLPARVRGDAAAPNPSQPGSEPAIQTLPVAPTPAATPHPSTDGVFLPVGISLREVEKAYVLKTLSSCGNNKTRAAQILGITRKALYDKLARWGITG